jgi:hypothetical protein
VVSESPHPDPRREEMRAEKEVFEREEWVRDGIRMDDSALYCD